MADLKSLNKPIVLGCPTVFPSCETLPFSSCCKKANAINVDIEQHCFETKPKLWQGCCLGLSIA